MGRMRQGEWIKEKTCPLSCLVKKKNRELKMGRLEGLHLDGVGGWGGELGRKKGFMRKRDRTRRSETVEKIKASFKLQEMFLTDE